MACVYRKSTIGEALIATIEEMLANGHMQECLIPHILRCFDEAVQRMFQSKMPIVNFRASRLANYRLCDNVWTLILDNPVFQFPKGNLTVERVKVVAVKALPGPPKSKAKPKKSRTPSDVEENDDE